MGQDTLQTGFHAFGAFAEARQNRLMKTLSYSGTSGALVLEALDREIERLVNYKNILRQNVRRVPGESDQYKVSRRTAGTTPGEFVAETGDFTDSEGSYAKKGFAYKTLGGRGKITRFAQATGRSFVNVMAEEIDARMEDFRDFEESKIIYGDARIANEFNGLHYNIDSTIVPMQVGCTAGAGTGSLTAAKLDELWDLTRLTPDYALTSFKGGRLLNAVTQTLQRYQNMVEVPGGFVVVTYQGTPILKSSRVLDTLVWNGTTATALTGGTSSVIYTWNADKFFIAELTRLQMMMLARTTSQWERYDIFEDIVPVLKNYCHAALLAGFE
jgi:hypothetical protein